MATAELSTMPESCFPDFLVKAVLDTDTIDLDIAAGVLTANIILDGTTGPCANRAVIVPGEGIYVAPPDVALVIADTAFADPSNPTAAEAAAAVAAATPVNQAGMIAYLIGDGTAANPDYIWYIDCAGTATLIESPNSLALAYEIGDGAFASPNFPTATEALTYALGLGVDLTSGAHFYKVGMGTPKDPDYAWFVDSAGTIVEIESPSEFLSEMYTAPILDTDIICGGFYIFDVSAGSVSQPLPATTPVPAGCKVGFKVTGNTGGTKLTLLPNGADTIDGDAMYDQMKDDGKTAFLVSNGSGAWYIAYDYDPILISGVLCDLQDGGLPQPLISLFGSGIPIIEGAVVADLAYEVRENDSGGALLQAFNGAPGAAVTPAGYLAGGTYDNPILDLTGYCGDVWVGFVATDDGGKQSNVCQLTYVDFGLVDITFTVLGDGAVTPEITINPGGITPTWDWGDGSPVETGTSMSHTYTGGAGTYYATATVCPTDVLTIDANGDRLQGGLSSMTDWSRFINLQQIILSDNDLGGGLPTEWGSLPLNAIYLPNNNLSGGLPAAWASIGSVLLTVYLNGNNLSGGIPAAWAALDGLVVLHLEDNGLEGTLDPSFSAWTDIVYFDISRNSVIGGSIPSSYAAWTSLQYFLAESCNLSGSLDPSFSAWTGMVAFSVANNGVSGSIPASYAAWTAIQSFSVANNALSGTLDPSFSAWTSISDFRASGNLLTGSIPASYAAWTSLRYFIVGSNQLSGTLDSGFGAWTDLLYFDISNNLLSGPIPASYAAWTILTHFTVQNNQIAGVLPPEYDAWTGILYFQAGNNLLSGTLPPEYGSFVNIRQFYVPNNYSLAGTLPATYGAWTQLLYGGFHETALSGPVPTSWSGMISLIDIYFGGGPVNYSTPGAASGWSQIKTVYFGNAGATSSEIEALLAEMVSAGVPNNGLFVSYNVPGAPMTAAACASLATLQGLGWTTAYDTGGAC